MGRGTFRGSIPTGSIVGRPREGCSGKTSWLSYSLLGKKGEIGNPLVGWQRLESSEGPEEASLTRSAIERNRETGRREGGHTLGKQSEKKKRKKRER